MCVPRTQSSAHINISKESGTKVFMMENLKHEKSQVHVSILKAKKACKKPEETSLVKPLHESMSANDVILKGLRQPSLL